METLSGIYSELYRAMIAKDTEKLEQLLDENFVLIHITGMRQSKREFIDAIKNGILNYYFCEESDISTECFGSTANIIGKSRVNAAVFGGGRNTWRLQLDLTLIKKDEDWKIINIKANTY